MAARPKEVVMTKITVNVNTYGGIVVPTKMRRYFNNKKVIGYGKYIVRYPIKDKLQEKAVVQFLEDNPDIKYKCSVCGTKEY